MDKYQQYRQRYARDGYAARLDRLAAADGREVVRLEVAPDFDNRVGYGYPTQSISYLFDKPYCFIGGDFGEAIFKLSGYKAWNDNELANDTGVDYLMGKCANAEQYKHYRETTYMKSETRTELLYYTDHPYIWVAYLHAAIAELAATSRL
jgi:hypothetical protein